MFLFIFNMYVYIYVYFIVEMCIRYGKWANRHI